ncbi:hypothetical protein GTY62_12205, partial [Streptomyces sp. SID724]|nr:hypothetical protein [Streptomyces sp. SID724]
MTTGTAIAARVVTTAGAVAPVVGSVVMTTVVGTGVVSSVMTVVAV